MCSSHQTACIALSTLTLDEVGIFYNTLDNSQDCRSEHLFPAIPVGWLAQRDKISSWCEISISVHEMKNNFSPLLTYLMYERTTAVCLEIHKVQHLSIFKKFNVFPTVKFVPNALSQPDRFSLLIGAVCRTSITQQQMQIKRAHIFQLGF